MFLALIDVDRKTLSTSIVHRTIYRPRPTPETGAPAIAENLLDLLPRVHHERILLHHGFVDRPTLQQTSGEPPTSAGAAHFHMSLPGSPDTAHSLILDAIRTSLSGEAPLGEFANEHE